MQVPFVTHGRTALKEQHAFFDFDNYAMTKQSVERLVRKGRRRLAMIPATPHLTCAAHFLDGFQDGVREAGVNGIFVPGLYLNDDPEKFRTAVMSLDLPVGTMINGWGVKFSETGQNSNERVQHYMLQWQNGQLVTVWPEEFTTNRAKWIPLGAWDARK